MVCIMDLAFIKKSHFRCISGKDYKRLQMRNKYQHLILLLTWATVTHVGTFHICELRRPRWACVSAQTCQRFRCFLTQSNDSKKQNKKTQTKILTSSSARCVSMGLCCRRLRMCDKYKRHTWASTRETRSSGVGKQQRRRPACAFAQSYQRLVIRFLESILSILPMNEMSLV